MEFHICHTSTSWLSVWYIFQHFQSNVKCFITFFSTTINHIHKKLGMWLQYGVPYCWMQFQYKQYFMATRPFLLWHSFVLSILWHAIICSLQYIFLTYLDKKNKNRAYNIYAQAQGSRLYIPSMCTYKTQSATFV